MPSTHQCHALCIHTGITVIMGPSMAALSHTWTLHHTCHAKGQWCQVRASSGNSITACIDGCSFITNNNGARQDRTVNVKRTQVKQGMVSQLARLLFIQTVRQGLNVSLYQPCPPRSLHGQFLRDVLQELEGARPDNPGFLKCPLPHAQLSPTAYYSLNMCHSYISMVSFCVFTLCNAINVLMFQNELVQVDVEVMRGRKYVHYVKRWRESGHTNINRKVQYRLELFLMGRCENYRHVGGYILDFRNNIQSLPHRLMFLTQPSVLFLACMSQSTESSFFF